jgi:hypothetical protein
MLVIVLGVKNEQRWKYLQKQYSNHSIINVKTPNHIPIYSNHIDYENEVFKKQIINFSKIKGRSVLFVTYDTIIDIRNIPSKDTIFSCSRLSCIFQEFQLNHYTLPSYEMTSDITINGTIRIFESPGIKDVANILFSNIVFLEEFEFPTRKEDILYFIPSIICPHSASIFTKEERLCQTINQLQSVHSYSTFNKTIVLEMSDVSSLTFSDLFRFSESASLVVLLGGTEFFRDVARSTNKNRGEIEALRFVLSQLQQQEFSHFYKFGGRYSLNSNYNDLHKQGYDATFKVMKAHENPYNRDVIEPVIYSISSSKKKDFLISLEDMSKKILIEPNLDVERMLVDFKESVRSYEISELSVNGYSAITGTHRYL